MFEITLPHPLEDRAIGVVVHPVPISEAVLEVAFVSLTRWPSEDTFTFLPRVRHRSTVDAAVGEIAFAVVSCQEVVDELTAITVAVG